MIYMLFRLLNKPVLWQRSAEPFWDDEHISKGMLEAHLNPDWDAASRKHSYIDRSVKWLSGFIPANGKILDLGCGPGLYTRRFSEMGYDVTGIDYSKRSIAYAKSQDTKTEYLYKNYLEIDFTNMFDAATLIYCDYAALTPDERQTLVKKVYKALKPGGLLILDVFSKKHFINNKANRTYWTLCKNGGFWSSEPYICLEATYLYDNNMVSVDQYVVVKNEGIKEYLIWDTAYTIPKLNDEVSSLGFSVKSVFDDVCGSPYTGESDTMCFILERNL